MTLEPSYKADANAIVRLLEPAMLVNYVLPNIASFAPTLNLHVPKEMHHCMCPILHVPTKMHHRMCSILHVPEVMHYCMCPIIHVPEEMHNCIVPDNACARRNSSLHCARDCIVPEFA